MCRFTLYLGPPVRLSTLLIEPTHSLIHQSFQSEERAEPLNGDGFGIGWYAPALTDEPAVFRSVTPAWNNQNLAALARVVCSPCVVAHVRAATPGMTVNEANCHPFQWGRYLFMHNGHIGAFQTVKRPLRASLTDEAYGIIQGSTDSEHLFALFVDEVLRNGGADPGQRMAECLNRAVWRALEMVHAHGNGVPSFLNIAVSDGERAAVCRFTDSQDRPAESLYYISGELYPPAYPESPGRRRFERSPAMVVSSERLTDDEGWTKVPRNSMVVEERDPPPRVMGMSPDGLVEPAARAS